MLELDSPIVRLYVILIGWASCGFVIGRLGAEKWATRLGKFLFWIGVPISIPPFMRRAVLGNEVILAPLIAWIAVLLGGSLAWLLLRQGYSNLIGNTTQCQARNQGSFLIASMFGNTGFIGYPVVLSLLGPKYFAWAVLYDLAGTTFGAYGLGVGLAAYFGEAKTIPTPQAKGWHHRWRSLQPGFQAAVRSPTLWSLLFGLGFRQVPLPAEVDQVLYNVAWGVVILSMVLIGMKLAQLSSLGKLKQALTCLSLKMIAVPLLIGLGLSLLPIDSGPRLVMVLQAAMPPAFATLVIGEAYQLDLDLTVTALVIGYGALLLMLPVWLWLFG